MELICIILGCVLLQVGCAAAETEGGKTPEEILAGMTLREKVAQMLLPSFRVWKEVPAEGEPAVSAESAEPAEETPGVNVTRLNPEIRDILVRRAYSIDCLNPATGDGLSSGVFDKIISARHEAGKTVILVSCQLPYDAARFPEADAVLLTYWGSTMAETPAEGINWSANLPAGLLSCFGGITPEGKLPVDIPELDEQYRPADRILYPAER